MATDLTIKRLQHADIGIIVGLAADLHAEVEREWPECPAFNPELVAEQVSQCMTIKMMHALGLFDGEQCQGVLVFTVYPCFGIGCTLGKEAMWYVRPQYRTAGLMMLKAFERLAVELGATQLEIGHFPMLNGERLCKLYACMGYKLHQLRYLKRSTT